jgi:hypothetical protein
LNLLLAGHSAIPRPLPNVLTFEHSGTRIRPNSAYTHAFAQDFRRLTWDYQQILPDAQVPRIVRPLTHNRRSRAARSPLPKTLTICRTAAPLRS